MPFWSRFEDVPRGRLPEGAAGEAVSRLLRSGLVEPDWMTPQPGGFEWWPSAHAQRVAATLAEPIEGLHVARILIEADVCDALPEGSEAQRRIDLLNQRASLSALVRREDGRVVWAASLLAHERNAGWTARMLPAVLALQAAEAPMAAEALAPAGGRPATSAPPGCEPRARDQEELARLCGALLSRDPAGTLDPRIFEDVAATLREAGLSARADRRGLDVEIPFAGELALLQMLGPMPHPGYGEGVLALLVLPVLSLRHALEGAGVAAVTAELNAQARTLGFHAESLPALGGVAPDPSSGHPALACFVPAPLAHDEVLTDLAMAQIARGLLVARAFDAAPPDEAGLRRALGAAI